MAVQPPVQAPPGPPEPKPRNEDETKLLTILEHLSELRNRLTWCAGAFVIALCASFYPLTGWFIEFLKQPGEDRIPGFDLYAFDPLEGWTTYFRVSLLLAVSMAMPMFVYQLLAFVSPGLRAAERRWVVPVAVGASLSFLAGCAFAYYVELPPALGFLLNPPGDIQPLISVSKYFNFVTRLMLVTGLVFEMPLIVMGLAKLGAVRSRQLLGWWRFAIVGAFIVSAVVTPSIDPVTQALVAGPIIGLYFLGIVLAKLVEGSPVIQR